MKRCCGKSWNESCAKDCPLRRFEEDVLARATLRTAENLLSTPCAVRAAWDTFVTTGKDSITAIALRHNVDAIRSERLAALRAEEWHYRVEERLTSRWHCDAIECHVPWLYGIDGPADEVERHAAQEFERDYWRIYREERQKEDEVSRMSTVAPAYVARAALESACARYSNQALPPDEVLREVERAIAQRFEHEAIRAGDSECWDEDEAVKTSAREDLVVGAQRRQAPSYSLPPTGHRTNGGEDREGVRGTSM